MQERLDEAAEFAEQAPSLGDEAALIQIGDRNVEVRPAGRLVYYLSSALARNPPDSTIGLFAPGEELEFQRRDLAGALHACGPLIRSASPQLRAGALLRSGRVWSQLHQPDRALSAYEELAGLGAIPAEEMPAGVSHGSGRPGLNL